MALTQAGLAGAIGTGLVAGGMLGPAVTQLAGGIAIGLMIWVPQLQVITADTGTLGVGAGVMAFAVPPPLLIGSLLVSYPANGILGPMAPLEGTGLGIGLGLGFAQGQMITIHPLVGSGSAIARVTGPPAFPSLMAGFGSVGMKGPGSVMKANAISTALVATLQIFTLPMPIVGAASPSGSGGVGTGKIV